MNKAFYCTECNKGFNAEDAIHKHYSCQHFLSPETATTAAKRIVQNWLATNQTFYGPELPHGILESQDRWIRAIIGNEFPHGNNLVKALGRMLNSPAPNQFVAVKYLDDVPVFGRVWENQGLVRH